MKNVPWESILQSKLFFVSSVLVTVWFQAKQIPDPGSGFSENSEKPILAGNYKIFLQKSSNFHMKNRGKNSYKDDF